MIVKQKYVDDIVEIASDRFMLHFPDTVLTEEIVYDFLGIGINLAISELKKVADDIEEERSGRG